MENTQKEEKTAKYTVLSVRLPPELRQRLDEQAQSERRSMNSLVRIYIEDKLGKVA